VPRAWTVYSTAPSTTRACGAVWHHRSPSDSLPGEAVRAAVVRAEMPGFFALAAGRRSIVQHRARVCGPERPRTPCADRLGERTKERRHGRAMSPRAVARQSPHCRTGRRGARTPDLTSGFSACEAVNPTRLPRSRFCCSFMRAYGTAGPFMTEGLAPAFRPLPARSTLLRHTMTI